MLHNMLQNFWQVLFLEYNWHQLQAIYQFFILRQNYTIKRLFWQILRYPSVPTITKPNIFSFQNCKNNNFRTFIYIVCAILQQMHLNINRFPSEIWLRSTRILFPLDNWSKVTWNFALSKLTPLPYKQTYTIMAKIILGKCGFKKPS